ncbi:MAG: cardiolipin synthase [Hyphomonadaceae bacterium]|nr:cardiolipin synthase [Hyphomonadaceae bacterium]
MIATPLTFFLHILIVVGLGLRIIYRKLAVNTALAWLIIIAALPFFGVGFYFLFGDHKLGRKRLNLGRRIRAYYQKAFGIEADDELAREIETSDYFKDLSKVISKETGFYPSDGNTIKLLSTSEKTISNIISDIDAAKKTCLMEFYIIDPAGKVESVLDAVIGAAERGVDCKILADALGSRAFFRSKWPEKMRDAGVEIQPSLSVGSIKSISKRTDLRNHRKLVIIDQKIGYIGSFNLVDPECFNSDKDCGEWVDIMVRVQGHAVSSFLCVFNTDFLFDTVGSEFDRDAMDELPNETPSNQHNRDAVLQLIPSGPEMSSSLIYETLVSAIFGAREKIVIITPYFVPDESIRLALANAARRGLDVSIIVPKQVDSTMVKYASESMYRELLKAGVKIFRYTDGMLHTKAVLVDHEVSFVGTVNMDMRSFYLNLEVTMVVFDADFSSDMSKLTDTYLAKSNEVDLEFWEERSGFQQFKENVFRLVGPLL